MDRRQLLLDTDVDALQRTLARRVALPTESQNRERAFESEPESRATVAILNRRQFEVRQPPEGGREDILPEQRIA